MYAFFSHFLKLLFSLSLFSRWQRAIRKVKVELHKHGEERTTRKKVMRLRRNTDLFFFLRNCRKFNDKNIGTKFGLCRMRTGDIIFIYSCWRGTHENFPDILSGASTFSPLDEMKLSPKYFFSFLRKLPKNKKSNDEYLSEMLQRQTRKLVYISIYVHWYRAAIKTWRLLLIADARWLPTSPVSAVRTCVCVCVCAHIVGWWPLPCRPDVVV